MSDRRLTVLAVHYRMMTGAGRLHVTLPEEYWDGGLLGEIADLRASWSFDPNLPDGEYGIEEERRRPPPPRA